MPSPSPEPGCAKSSEHEPVEEALVDASVREDAGVEKSDEARTDDMQKAMERWVEMVQCVRMLESIEWLDTLADTP